MSAKPGLVSLLLCGALLGCAAAPEAESKDPLARVNRFVYHLNGMLDQLIIRPASRAYVFMTPPPIRGAVTNIFHNLASPGVILNDLLQGKGRQGAQDLGRFAANSTLGLAGTFDVASRWGWERHSEDFGQTLGVWGAPRGAYLVVPVLGPSTVRDFPGLLVSAVTNPIAYLDHDELMASAWILATVDRRSRVDAGFEARNREAEDPYLFTREAYLQHREFLLYDGDPPADTYAEEIDDLLDELEDIDDLDELED